MALTAEQKRRKREKKLEKAGREVAEPISRPRTERPLLGEFLGCCLRGFDGNGGLGNLVVVRTLTAGGARVAGFLIDPDCLGVKDAFWSDRSASAARRSLAGLRADEECLDISPSQARRILEQAVDFARGLGFEPEGDYTGSASILGDVESTGEETVVRFPSREKLCRMCWRAFRAVAPLSIAAHPDGCNAAFLLHVPAQLAKSDRSG
jgi:hypothetical protein